MEFSCSCETSFTTCTLWSSSYALKNCRQFPHKWLCSIRTNISHHLSHKSAKLQSGSSKFYGYTYLWNVKNLNRQTIKYDSPDWTEKLALLWMCQVIPAYKMHHQIWLHFRYTYIRTNCLLKLLCSSVCTKLKSTIGIFMKLMLGSSIDIHQSIPPLVKI